VGSYIASGWGLVARGTDYIIRVGTFGPIHL
jgi:hypothetical protein